MHRRNRDQNNRGRTQRPFGSTRLTPADRFTAAVTAVHGRPPANWRPEPLRVIRDLYLMKMMGQLWFEGPINVKQLTGPDSQFIGFEELSKRIAIHFNEDWPNGPPPTNYDEIFKLPLEVLEEICTHLPRPPWAIQR